MLSKQERSKGQLQGMVTETLRKQMRALECSRPHSEDPHSVLSWGPEGEFVT